MHLNDVCAQEVHLGHDDQCPKDNRWYPDIGATNHMTGRVDHLTELDSNIKDRVKFDDDRSTLMVMMGYEEGSKAYQMYDSVFKQVHINRDVVFDERARWNWTSSSESEVMSVAVDTLYFVKPVISTGSVHDSEGGHGPSLPNHAPNLEPPTSALSQTTDDTAAVQTTTSHEPTNSLVFCCEATRAPHPMITRGHIDISKPNPKYVDSPDILVMAAPEEEDEAEHYGGVKSEFLNGELEEEVYVTQLLGFVQEGQEQKVSGNAKEAVLSRPMIRYTDHVQRNNPR